MSSRCPSRLPGFVDTLSGLHRGPVTSEKCWLDSAVRELSRVAAGRAQGQEAVWKHKPAWWDGESSGLTWKNPTTDHKDTKDTLRKRLECLVKHLRLEQLIPSELEEEIQLWEAGRWKEIERIRSCSIILGHFNSVNRHLSEIFNRPAESEISISRSFLCNLEKYYADFRHLFNIVNSVSVQDSGSSNQTQLISSVPKPTVTNDHEEDSYLPAKRALVTSSTVSSSSSLPLFFNRTPETPVPFTSASNSDPSAEVDSDFKHAGHSSAVTPVLQQIDIRNKPDVELTLQRSQVSTGVKRKRVPASSLSEPTKRGKVGKSIAMDMTAAPSGSVESSSPLTVSPTAAEAASLSTSSTLSTPLSSSSSAAAALASSLSGSFPPSSFLPPSAVAPASSSMLSSSSLSSSSPSSSPLHSVSSFSTPADIRTHDLDKSCSQEVCKLFEILPVDKIVEALEYSQDTTLTSKVLDVAIRFASKNNMNLSDSPLASANSLEPLISTLMQYILPSDSPETAAGCEAAFWRQIEESSLEKEAPTL